MPYTGEAHIAAEVMIGGLDGQIVYGPGLGPGAQAHLFTAFIGQEWVTKAVDPELRQKLHQDGCVRVELRELEDKPILGVLNLEQGKVRYYQGEEVFDFLQPWLPTLAARVIAQRQPLYRLDPADWEIGVMAQFGTDKRLPQAAHAGLAVAQLHRVFAMGRSLDVKGRTAIQGEPGTGKTRLAAAAAARSAYRWRQRNTEFLHTVQPAWIAGLRRAWLKNPQTLALLGLEPVYGRRVKGERGGKGKVVLDTHTRHIVAYREMTTGRLIAPEDAGPRALPVLVTTPLKVTKEYGKEVVAAFPQAEVVHIENHRDIVRWLERCATSAAPVVFGVVSHSLKKAYGRAWQPVVLKRQHTTQRPDLDPPCDLLPLLEPAYDMQGRRQRLIGYRFKQDGQLLTKTETVTYFHCPDCGGRIEAIAGLLNQPDEEKKQDREAALRAAAKAEKEDKDRAEPVTSEVWFTAKQRWCTCRNRRNLDRRAGGKLPLRAPLWQDNRLETTNRRYPPCTFAAFSAAMRTVGEMARGATKSASTHDLVELVRRDERRLTQLVELALRDPDLARGVLDLVERVDPLARTVRQRLDEQATQLATLLTTLACHDEAWLRSLVRGAMEQDAFFWPLAQVAAAHDPDGQEVLLVLRDALSQAESQGRSQESHEVSAQGDIQAYREAIADLLVRAALSSPAGCQDVLAATLCPVSTLVELAQRDLRSLMNMVPSTKMCEDEMARLAAEISESEAQLTSLVFQAARRDGSHLLVNTLVEATRASLNWDASFFRSTFEQLHNQPATTAKKSARQAPRGVRLSEAEGGPIVVEAPDRCAASGYEEVRDACGNLYAYQLGHQGKRLLPLYGLWSRRITGYVEEKTGRLVTKQTCFAFRTPPPDSFSPYCYLYDFYRGCVALAVVDESHNGRGKDTDIAQAHRQAMRAAQLRMLTSGTHYGGDILGFYHYWFAYNPSFWIRLGFGWNSAEQALSRYGVIQEWTKEYESDARKGSGQTNTYVSTVPAPGLSANLIPGLLEDLTYLTVLDVGAHMPPKIEIPHLVPMLDEVLEQEVKKAEQQVTEAKQAVADLERCRREVQALSESEVGSREVGTLTEQLSQAEARRTAAWAKHAEVQAWAAKRDLNHAYSSIVHDLEDMARTGNTAARLALGTVPRWFAALPCAAPPYEVYHTPRGDWGEKGEPELVIRTPTLAWDHVYPLERWLKEVVAKERAEGRRVMLYIEQNGIRRMAKRLEWVLADFAPWTLPDSVEAEDRQQAILDAVADGHPVVVVPYARVNEGLNLQSALDTIVWVELALNLFMYIQASQRIWRLGKENECRIYIPAYIGTAGHKKLRKLGGQSGAAAAFAGEVAKGGLIEQTGADRTTLARLSASLEQGEEEDLFASLPVTEVEEENALLREAFARRNQELREALARGRQWFGLIDTLPQRWAAGMSAQRCDVWARQASVSSLVEVQTAVEAPVVAEVPEAEAQDHEHQDTVSVIEGSVPVRPEAERPAPVSTRASTQPQVILTVTFGSEEDIKRARARRGTRPVRKTPRPKHPTTVKHIPAWVEMAVPVVQADEEIMLLSIWDMPDESNQAPVPHLPLTTTVLGSLWEQAS